MAAMEEKHIYFFCHYQNHRSLTAYTQSRFSDQYLSQIIIFCETIINGKTGSTPFFKWFTIFCEAMVRWPNKKGVYLWWGDNLVNICHVTFSEQLMCSADRRYLIKAAVYYIYSGTCEIRHL